MTRTPLTLICFAALAIGLVFARACLQSVTIDEANVALGFATNPSVVQWFPQDENHVLNTLLERLSASIFPLSALTIRLPAFLGASLYICAALWFCIRITTRKIVQLPLLLCLVYNPLILDFLVAARGYSLAIGFLFVAIAVVTDTLLAAVEIRSVNLRARCVWVSVLTALSSASNFSFAFVNAATLLLFFLWVAAQYRESGRASYASLAASCFLPGVAVGFVLCVSSFWNPISRVDPVVGAQSLNEMWRIMAASSFDDLNPEIVNPLLLAGLNHIRPWLPYVWILAFVVLLAGVEINHRDLSDSNPRRLRVLTRFLAAIAALTLLLHWIAFHALHISLPKGRSSLFLVLLITLLFGAALAFRLQSWSPATYCCVGVLILVAVYFTACLRIGYFKEWRYDADTKRLYSILSDLHRRCGITRFVADWRYYSPLTFYRAAYGKQSLPEFPMTASGELPTDRDAYALFYATSEDFIKKQRLQVLYHNDESGAAIAIRGCEAALIPVGPARQQ